MRRSRRVLAAVAALAACGGMNGVGAALAAAQPPTAAPTKTTPTNPAPTNPAPAQPPITAPVGTGSPTPVAPPPIDPLDVTGRDFAGLVFDVYPQRGSLVFSSLDAQAWQEEPERAADGRLIGDPVQRLYLKGDVRITVGVTNYSAARATVWLQKRGLSAQRPGHFVYQLAIYFDRVSDPQAEAGTTQTADRLLMTGLVDAEPDLRTFSLSQRRPADPFVAEGERRLARFLISVSAPEANVPEEPAGPAPKRDPNVTGIPVPGVSKPYSRGSPLGEDVPGTGVAANIAAEAAAGLPPAEATAPIVARHSIITFSAGNIVYQQGGGGRESGARTSSAGPPGERDANVLVTDPQEDAVIISDGAVVEDINTAKNQTLQLSAQRAVIFFRHGALSAGASRLSSDDVHGIYLEGNVVATDGQYTLRGPQIYYDVIADKAYVVDAVFWTYDEQRHLPFYVRAKSLAQLARAQVQGKDVRISTSSFFTPELALGASAVTITREQPLVPVPAALGGGVTAGAANTHIDAQGLTIQAAGVPVFGWPHFSGDVENVPFREVRFENSSASGFGVKTRWDLFGLTGISPSSIFDKDTKVDATLLLDGWIQRGAGIGADLNWKSPGTDGKLLAYMVPDDHGRDVLSSGAELKHHGDFRGVLIGDHQWAIDENWTLQLQAGQISDENFIQAYSPEMAETAHEFENSIYLRRIDENSEFSGLAKYTFNDFTANQYLLLSQGYTVNKYPDIDYTRVNDDLLAGIAPGLVSYTSEFRFTSMNMAFTETNAALMGFPGALAGDAFGLLPGQQTIADKLRAEGLTEKTVNRFDTRHQLSMTFDEGPVHFTPFLTGRFTAYDEKFTDFSPQDDSQERLWGSAGLRVSTQVQHIDDGFDAPFLDMHRLRNIIEPSMTLWTAGTNLHQADLPVYDDSVESIAEGSAIRAGVASTWQTQRGGEGRWRSVDVLKASFDVVYSTPDTDRESPIGHFFDYEPELSDLGKYATTNLMWQTTDALALTFQNIYSFDTNQSARTTVGAILQHSRDLSTFAELHFLNATNSTYVDFGAMYRLTPKYTVSADAVYDTNVGEFQSTSARLNREFQSAIVSAKLSFNNITDEVSVGLVITPVDGDRRREQLRRLGRDTPDAGLAEPVTPTPLPGDRES